MVYLQGRMGNNRAALLLIIDRIGSVEEVRGTLFSVLRADSRIAETGGRIRQAAE